MSIAALAGLALAQAPKSKSSAAGRAAGAARAADNGAEADDVKGPKKKKEATSEELPSVTLPDPAVDAIVATKPTTPSELVRAAKALADLRRPDLARQYLKKVLDANLDPKALAALADEFGTAMFAGIASRHELIPEGKQVADAVLDARIKQLQDPQRLAALIQKLGDPSPEVRGQAIAGLRDAGAAAVGPLVAVLADAQRSAEHAGVRAALTALGPDAHGPLVAMLDSSEPEVVVEAIRVLGSLRAATPGYFLLRACCQKGGNPEVRSAAEAAVGQLWGRVPGRHRASQLLADLSRRHTKRIEPLPEDASGQVVLWSWDSAKRQATAKGYAPAAAARRFAARLARDAYAILPESHELQVLSVTATLEEKAYESGRDQPPAGMILRLSPDGKTSGVPPEIVEDVLSYAISSGQSAAATVAAGIIGQQSDGQSLLYRKAEPCPLVLATRHADRRLRLAAVEAVMRLQPRRPYAGASYVCEALGFMAASRGARRVLIASPSFEEPMRLGAFLAKLGYETDSATTGRELVRKALQSPDYELVLVEAIVSYPTADEVLQSLRRDGRTALLPVGVVARLDDLERARHMVRHDPRAEALVRPHDLPTVRRQVEDLAARSGDAPTAAERKRHAAMALDWLAQLSEPTGGGLYDLSRVEGAVLSALASGDLAVKACAVLGNLGTPEAQQALVDLASRKTASAAERKAAIGGFRTAVQRRGILLTIPKIQLQYDRYNQSAKEDPAMQAALGMILDCIEAPTKPRKQASRRGVDEAPQMAHGGIQP